MVLTDKNGGFTITQTNVFVNSEHVSAQEVHYQLSIEKCTNGNGITVLV
jgi:hypothetical protein